MSSPNYPHAVEIDNDPPIPDLEPESAMEASGERPVKNSGAERKAPSLLAIAGVVVAASGIVITVLLWIFGETRSDIRNVQSEVGGIRESVGIIRGELSGLKGNVGAMEGQVNEGFRTVNDAVNDLRGNMEYIRGRLDASREGVASDSP